MQIDAFTVMVSGLLVKALLGALFFLYWVRDRQSTWFAWFSITFILGDVATLMFIVRGFAGEVFAVGAGAAFILAAMACCWQGARTFEGRRPLWSVVVLVPVLWLAASAGLGLAEDAPVRVVASSVIVAGLLLLSGFEFWRGRREALPSRWPIIAMFAALAVFFLTRIGLVSTLPFPFGALPIHSGYVAAFNLIMFCHVLLLTVLIVAMSKERLELAQRTKAQTDPLTGTLNRRAFVALGNRLLRRHSHEGAPLSLLFLDLDHFKSFNDRFGHSGGDDVLLGFVALLTENIRPTDYLFRIGGEEFCCLLPYTASEPALRVAERIRHDLEQAAFKVSGQTVKTTVSIGVASTESFGYDLDTLTRRADMAVYAAKRQGRNRVKIADPADRSEIGEGELHLRLTDASAVGAG